MVPQIPIENLYYLLCYAWDVTDQLNKVKVDGEHSHSLENLLASVLTNACERLLRRGLVQEYLFREQEVDGIRGKLNLAETLNPNRSLENDKKLFLMTAIRKAALYMLDS